MLGHSLIFLINYNCGFFSRVQTTIESRPSNLCSSPNVFVQTSAAEMGDELSSLLAIFKKVEESGLPRSGGLATLSVTTKSGENSMRNFFGVGGRIHSVMWGHRGWCYGESWVFKVEGGHGMIWVVIEEWWGIFGWGRVWEGHGCNVQCQSHHT